MSKSRVTRSQAAVVERCASAPIPSRHGADLSEGRRIARPVRWLIRGNPEPSPEQWQAQGESLRRGDPPADRLATWMRLNGLASTMPLFERALERGIESVPEAAAPLRAFFAQADRRPAWWNEAQLDEGARACHRSGLTGLRALRDVALMGGYQASAINRTLVLTGALQRGAQRRLAETTKWWIDCTEPGGLARFGSGCKSTLRVRLMHALVRAQVRNLPEWNVEELGLPINQSDMHGTYLGFSVVFLLGQRALGVLLTRREAQAVMNLWRAIGWLMGVEEPWLCETEMEGRIALYRNLIAQAPPDASSVQLGRALMDEPLQRHYPHFAGLRGRFERARHLSICRLFHGRAGMRALGLPEGTLPWYPLLSAPMIAVAHLATRLAPAGEARLAQRGRAAQLDYLNLLFGKDRPTLRSVQANELAH